MLVNNTNVADFVITEDLQSSFSHASRQAQNVFDGEED